jgi:hypothetical protein
MNDEDLMTLECVKLRNQELENENAKLKARIDELLDEKLIEVDREQFLKDAFIGMFTGWSINPTVFPLPYSMAMQEAAEALAVWEAEAPKILKGEG